jgi:replication factor C small subunit
VILVLADYQYKAAFVADKELNTVACLTEIMASSEWK